MSRFLKIFIGILLIAFALLPWLASTEWGTGLVVKGHNAVSKQKLSIGNLNLTWFGTQRIEKLLYTDEKGETIASADSIQTETSLFYLLFGGRRLGDTVIETPFMRIEPGEGEANGDGWRLPEDVTVVDGTLVFEAPDASPITLSDIRVEKQGTPPTYQIRAKSVQGDLHGKIDIEIKMGERIEAKGVVKNFPVAILDRMRDTTLFTTAIGPHLDLEFNASRDPDESIALSAALQSKNLTGLIEGQTEQGKFYLLPSSHLTFTLTPKLFQEILPEKQQGEWSLASDAHVKLEITQGVFPLENPTFKNSILQAKGEVGRVEINHKSLSGFSLNNFKLEVTSLDNLQLAFQGDIQGKEASTLSGTASFTPKGDLLFTLNSKGFPISFISIFSPEVEQNLHRLFGTTFDLHAEGIYRDNTLDASYTLTGPTLQAEGTVKGALRQLTFTAIGEKKVEGKTVDYLGEQVTFDLSGALQIAGEELSIPTLRGKFSSPTLTATLKGSVGRGLDLSQTKFKLKGNLLKLDGGTFSLLLDGASNTLTGSLDSSTLTAKFKVKELIQNDAFDFAAASYTFDCDLDGFPIALLNPFMPEGLDLTMLFGKRAQVKAHGRYTPDEDPRGILDFVGRSDGFDAAFSVALDDTLSVSQNQDAYIHWELTPERYEALIHAFDPDEKPAFLLSRPASVDLSIKELRCPTTPPEGISSFLCQSGFVGDIKIGTLTFISYQTQEYLVIKDIAGSVEGKNLSDAIDFNLSGEVLAQNIPHSETSTFTFSGKVLNMWTPEGHFNREGLSLDGELSLELLPVKEITEVFPMDGETRQLLQAVLGELVNARIYGTISQLTGPLTVDVKASNFKATLPIMVHPHAIYLRDAVEMEITLTEAVNRTLIADINPLLIAGAYSDHPIRVYLDPQDFVVPIRPYSLQGVRIGKAVIDIGRIRVRNGGQIQQLMNFLKAKEVTPEGEMEAWFTPIYMSLSDGVATYQRFDALLAKKVHIALWGSINLVTDQVRMTLGIATSTLKERFGIKGLDKKDMFQVKMRGTTDNLDLDWSAASTRIGLIIAQSAGGGIGKLVGGILETIVKALGDAPPPPPTTSPFPWER